MTKRKQRENLDWDGLHAFLRDAYDAGREDGRSEGRGDAGGEDFADFLDGNDYAKRVCDLLDQVQSGKASTAEAEATAAALLKLAH